MKKDQYRCSCCDELKADTNGSYEKWDNSSTTVKICKSCKLQVAKSKYKTVKGLLGWL